jgi:hypothetical protein
VKFDFERLPQFLRKQADDPEVVELVGLPDQIERFEYQGYVVFRNYGISVMFKEAPWVVPPTEIANPRMLHLDAFHFHREGHEGHSQYPGRLPGGVAFGDSAAELIHKLGPPIAGGGGGSSTVLKKPIPHWLKYHLGRDMLHLQLDEGGTLEMATLYTQDLQQVQANQ